WPMLHKKSPNGRRIPRLRIPRPCARKHKYKDVHNFLRFASPKSDTIMASLTSALLARNPDYIYPLVVNLIAGVVPVWASLKVSAARKKVGLKYPAEYCPGPLDEKTDREKF